MQQALKRVHSNPQPQGHLGPLVPAQRDDAKSDADERQVPEDVEGHDGLRVCPVALARLQLLGGVLADLHRRLAEHHAPAAGPAQEPRRRAAEGQHGAAQEPPAAEEVVGHGVREERGRVHGVAQGVPAPLHRGRGRRVHRGSIGEAGGEGSARIRGASEAGIELRPAAATGGEATLGSRYRKGQSEGRRGVPIPARSASWSERSDSGGRGELKVRRVSGGAREAEREREREGLGEVERE